MVFTKIDMESWPRAQMFYYFSAMAPTGYSLTVRVNVTRMKELTAKHGLKFFPAYLWAVTKNLNRQMEFKIALCEGVLGYYDTLTPLYASFHEDDKTFSLMWTAYDEDFREFHQRYLDNQKKFGGCHGVLSQTELPPANAYTVSCIPWVSFDHFAVHSYQDKPYYFPSVEAGKIVDHNGGLWMPLSLTCHHAAVDGYHVNKFLENLQADLNGFEAFL